MEQRKNAGAGHGEKRHRLSEAVDRCAPLLPEQKQNRRDQSSRVADTDPENKVRNIPGPTDRLIISPDSDTVPNQPPEHRAQDSRDAAGHRQSDVPRVLRSGLYN